MTQLLIARHGNTFGPEDRPVRVGKRSDIPLVASGRRQARRLGAFLHEKNIALSAVYTGNLVRSYETATIALEHVNMPLSPVKTATFDEVDYGIDEGKTEQQIVARIGEGALRAWEQAAVVPSGWLIDPHQIIQNWRDFAQMIKERHKNQTVLVVTSHGITRFAPYLTSNISAFKKEHSLKMATGALSCLTAMGEHWHVDYWNRKVGAESQAAGMVNAP